MKVPFYVHNGELVAVYSDELARHVMPKLCKDVSYRRVSHIDPTEDGKHFQIIWLRDELVQFVGESVTTTNEEGAKFETKQEAETLEQQRVEEFLRAKAAIMAR